MTKHVTAHFPDAAAAEAAKAALTEANIYAYGIRLADEPDGRVALHAEVQDEEVERATEILKGERAPNQTDGLDAAEGTRSDGDSGMVGGPRGTWSREEQVRPDGSATEPRDYMGSEGEARDPDKSVR